LNTSTIERARRYISAVPGAISGGEGHNQTFKIAIALVHGFGLSLDDSFSLLLEYNAKCDPPWSESDLQHKLRDVDMKPSKAPRGYLLENNNNFKATKAAPQAKLPLDRFIKGNEAQLKQLAKSRPYGLEGLRFASARGLLVFGDWYGHTCYGVRDKAGKVLELRRMDKEMFPKYKDQGPHISHAVGGSKKPWPVGILEAEPYDKWMLVEGIPDFIQAHQICLWEQASHYSKQDVSCRPWD